jgi:hypothetical protein
MRERGTSGFAVVLAPAFAPALAAVLLAVACVPLAVGAASGLPPTVTLSPPLAGPGSRVDVVGLDFPAGQQVALQLTTTAGPVALGTTLVEEGGYFRQQVTFPTDLAPGFWELRATAPGGAVAVHIFEALDPARLAARSGTAPAPAGSGATPAPPSDAPLLDPNAVTVLVLVLFAVLLAGAAAFVWLQTHRRPRQGDLPAGDDPIWSGVGGDSQ